MEPLYASVIALARGLFAAEGLRFTMRGTEHIPATGGAVLVMNHIGYFDFAYAGLACRKSNRLVRFMCKDTIFDHPIAGPLMRGMKHIPVDREAGLGSLRAAMSVLKAGEIVGVFPEATISRSFEIKGFKSGAVRMAQASKVPIIPMIIWGSQRVWTKGRPKRLWRTNTPITILVGEPIEVPKGTDVEAVLARLREQMIAMLHEAQETYEPLTGRHMVFQPARLGGSAPTLEQAAVQESADAAARRAAKGLPPVEPTD